MRRNNFRTTTKPGLQNPGFFIFIAKTRIIRRRVSAFRRWKMFTAAARA
jgi:hypothetical protein